MISVWEYKDPKRPATAININVILEIGTVQIWYCGPEMRAEIHYEATPMKRISRMGAENRWKRVYP